MSLPKWTMFVYVPSVVVVRMKQPSKAEGTPNADENVCGSSTLLPTMPTETEVYSVKRAQLQSGGPSPRGGNQHDYVIMMIGRRSRTVTSLPPSVAKEYMWRRKFRKTFSDAGVDQAGHQIHFTHVITSIDTEAEATRLLEAAMRSHEQQGGVVAAVSQFAWRYGSDPVKLAMRGWFRPTFDEA
eukprot:118577-Amphidinium_carterae.1